MPINIRPADHNDLALLQRMLYEAAYWREDKRPSLELGLSTPEIRKLLANWGQPGDCAVVAEDDGQGVGAAWYRFWSSADHSYGFVSSDIPELAIGVSSEYRGRGVGRNLLSHLLSAAGQAGIAQISLSVESGNPALNLYESIGFKAVGKVENSLTMVVQTEM